MKKGLTELVFILDRSGSMQGLEADTIGGFNSMVEHMSLLSFLTTDGRSSTTGHRSAGWSA